MHGDRAATERLRRDQLKLSRAGRREADEADGEGGGNEGTYTVPSTDLIILTNDITEDTMNAAMAQMQALKTVLAPIVWIRKEELA